MTNLEFLESLGEEKLRDLFGWHGISYLCSCAYYAKEGRNCSLHCDGCPMGAILTLSEPYRKSTKRKSN